jgi:uncharacterized membrane-anchored protein YhcB (DUF1043 family)
MTYYIVLYFVFFVLGIMIGMNIRDSKRQYEEQRRFDSADDELKQKNYELEKKLEVQINLNQSLLEDVRHYRAKAESKK